MILTAADYLQALRDHLTTQSVPGRDDILQEIATHFADAQAAGRPESDVIRDLGDPHILASGYRATALVEAARHSTSVGGRLRMVVQVLLLLLLLAPFHVFFLSIPGVVLLALLAAGWAVVVAMGSAAGIGLAWATGALFHGIPLLLGAALICFALTALGLGGMGLLLMLAMTWGIGHVVIRYVRWIVRVICRPI